MADLNAILQNFTDPPDTEAIKEEYCNTRTIDTTTSSRRRSGGNSSRTSISLDGVVVSIIEIIVVVVVVPVCNSNKVITHNQK